MSDILSDLPDCVLLHIMKFLNIKDAIQTCVLSKRWKDLWKCLTNLTFDSNDFIMLSDNFNKVVSSVLSCRDDSVSLHNLDLSIRGYTDTKILNRVMTYAASHDVQQLTIEVNLNFKKDFELSSSVFCCRSLTYLKLCSCLQYYNIVLPKSLELPALKSLHIENVTFTTSDNGCAEPFSTCNSLNSLVIDNCFLLSDAKVLHISNSKLSNLTIMFSFSWRMDYPIMLSSHNLSVLTIKGGPIHQLCSACNLPFLEEVNISLSYFEYLLRDGLGLLSWLQVFVNVKILTLSGLTHCPWILNDLLSRGSFRTQLPCFVRLKSLKLMESFSNISDEEISRMVEYLLHNSPFTRVDILKC